MTAKSFIFLFLSLVLNQCSSTQIIENESIKIQELKNFYLGGNNEEWAAVPSRKLYADPIGHYPMVGDLQAEFKLAWKEKDLLLFISIKDDGITSDSTFPWKGDAVELFLTDFHGSDNIVQYSIVTGTEKEGEALVKIQDMRKMAETGWNSPGLKSYLRREGKNISLELQLSYSIFGTDPRKDVVNLQLYINDSDPMPGDSRNQLSWYPLGHSYMNSFASYPLQLTAHENTVFPGTSRLIISDNKKVDLYIFGAIENDRISVYRGRELLVDTVAASGTIEIPDAIDLSSKELDFSNDSVYVYLNGDFTGFHNLILAPVIYSKTPAPRFEREIKLFKLKDRLSMPEPGSALFIGSSSIRMWNSVQKDFPELSVIHRGFGGSISSDVVNYMEEIVLPYQPSIIVYYEGDNDISQGISNEEIIKNMKIFIDGALERNPETRIYLLSPKPAIVRMHLWENYISLHAMMKELAANYSNVQFVDVANAMFNKNGQLMRHIFADDSLHMNMEGYTIWTKVLREDMGLEKQ